MTKQDIIMLPNAKTVPLSASHYSHSIALLHNQEHVSTKDLCLTFSQR